MKNRRNSIAFWAGVAVFLVAALSMTQIVRNEYPFFAGYVILQFIALAVAWILARSRNQPVATSRYMR